MKINVSRVEVQGWLNLIVAVAGLYFTATSGTDTLDAIARFSTAGSLPPEFAGSQGIIRVFLFLLMLMIFGSMLFIGLAIMLGQLFRSMGSPRPNHTAFTLIAGLLAATIALTFGIFGEPLWMLAGMISLLLLVCTGIAGSEGVEGPEGGIAYWFILVIGGVAVMLFGTFVVGLASQDVAASAATAVSQTANPSDAS
ncbi:hypothetical protein ACIQTU_08625 [Brevundimonas sp. NPDC090276]|uniref:hypothetical protein n=1 Tax=Brevundimonas sp. NPDC090276 TaxID=3363956 RepID=UPI00383AD63E